jgi:hypothetical protein
MTTKEVADILVKHCSEGKFEEAMKALYSDDIVSMEAEGEWWVANHEVHSAVVEGPLVAGSHFAVVFKLDVTFKPQSRRFTMEEVAVYKVVDGKIVYEEFFYNM